MQVSPDCLSWLSIPLYPIICHICPILDNLICSWWITPIASVRGAFHPHVLHIELGIFHISRACKMGCFSVRHFHIDKTLQPWCFRMSSFSSFTEHLICQLCWDEGLSIKNRKHLDIIYHTWWKPWFLPMVDRDYLGVIYPETYCKAILGWLRFF